MTMVKGKGGGARQAMATATPERSPILFFSLSNCFCPATFRMPSSPNLRATLESKITPTVDPQAAERT